MGLINELNKQPVYLWVTLFVLLLTQSSWIFWDASKRGEKKWLWGLLGLLNVPSSLLIYLIVTRAIVKNVPCPHCSKNVRINYSYCPYCGKKINNKESSDV